MIITEYNVLNNIRKKLQRDNKESLEMMMSVPVENTQQITHFKSIYRYTEDLLESLEDYSKKLEDPDWDEENLKNFFGEE